MRIAGGEMTRTMAGFLAAMDAEAFDVYQPDVVLAVGMLRARTIAELAQARNRWFTPHTWTNGIGVLANLHVAAGVGGGPFLEYPYDPPGWTPERRDFMLAEPLRPGARRHPPRPRPAGPRDRPGRSGREAVRGMTVDAVPADPHAFTFDDWTSRARDLRPHALAVIDGRSVPSASGKTYPDVTGRDGTTIADVAEGGEEDVDRAVGAARAAFDDGRWSDLAPVDRKKLLLRFAELMRGDLEYLALVEALDCGKPIRDTLRVDAAKPPDVIQWYAEAIDKLYGEVGPTGPGALSLVTREPIGVVATIVPWNYPLIITAWKIGAALAAGNTVVLKPASQSPLSAIRLGELALEAGIPPACSTSCPARARSSAGRSPAIPASTRSPSPARPTWASRSSGTSARPTSRASASSSAARARRSCWATSPTWMRRRRHRLGDLLQLGPDVQRGFAPHRRPRHP